MADASPADDELVCQFCSRKDLDEEIVGTTLVKGTLVVHQFCMYFTTLGLVQRASEGKGLMGFLESDIRKEIMRGKRQSTTRGSEDECQPYCEGCGKHEAFVRCAHPDCHRAGHFPCLHEIGFIFQHFGQFDAFCPDHQPKQKPLPLTSFPELSCCICLCDLSTETIPSYTVIYMPCCNHPLHRDCIQRYARSAGLHFFQCPVCKDKKLFIDQMLLLGIEVPDRDASWETDGSYEDLSSCNYVCTISPCLCPNGPEYFSDEDNYAETCQYCGQCIGHRDCVDDRKLLLMMVNDRFVCDDCRPCVKRKRRRKPVKIIEVEEYEFEELSEDNIKKVKMSDLLTEKEEDEEETEEDLHLKKVMENSNSFQKNWSWENFSYTEVCHMQHCGCGHGRNFTDTGHYRLARCFVCMCSLAHYRCLRAAAVRKAALPPFDGQKHHYCNSCWQKHIDNEMKQQQQNSHLKRIEEEDLSDDNETDVESINSGEASANGGTTRMCYMQHCCQRRGRYFTNPTLPPSKLAMCGMCDNCLGHYGCINFAKRHGLPHPPQDFKKRYHCPSCFEQKNRKIPVSKDDSTARRVCPMENCIYKFAMSNGERNGDRRLINCFGCRCPLGHYYCIWDAKRRGIKCPKQNNQRAFVCDSCWDLCEKIAQEKTETKELTDEMICRMEKCVCRKGRYFETTHQSQYKFVTCYMCRVVLGHYCCILSARRRGQPVPPQNGLLRYHCEKCFESIRSSPAKLAASPSSEKKKEKEKEIEKEKEEDKKIEKVKKIETEKDKEAPPSKIQARTVVGSPLSLHYFDGKTPIILVAAVNGTDLNKALKGASLMTTPVSTKSNTVGELSKKKEAPISNINSSTKKPISAAQQGSSVSTPAVKCSPLSVSITKWTPQAESSMKHDMCRMDYCSIRRGRDYFDTVSPGNAFTRCGKCQCVLGHYGCIVRAKKVGQPHPPQDPNKRYHCEDCFKKLDWKTIPSSSSSTPSSSKLSSSSKSLDSNTRTVRFKRVADGTSREQSCDKEVKTKESEDNDAEDNPSSSADEDKKCKAAKCVTSIMSRSRNCYFVSCNHCHEVIGHYRCLLLASRNGAPCAHQDHKRRFYCHKCWEDKVAMLTHNEGDTVSEATYFSTSETNHSNNENAHTSKRNATSIDEDAPSTSGKGPSINQAESSSESVTLTNPEGVPDDEETLSDLQLAISDDEEVEDDTEQEEVEEASADEEQTELETFSLYISDDDMEEEEEEEEEEEGGETSLMLDNA